MTKNEAIEALRATGWAPGVSTSGHPHRARIKKALAALKQMRVDVGELGLVHRPELRQVATAAPEPVAEDQAPTPEPPAEAEASPPADPPAPARKPRARKQS